MVGKKQTIAFVANSSWYLYNLRFGVISFLKGLGYSIITIAPADSFSRELEKIGKYIPVFSNQNGVNPITDIQLYFEYCRIYSEYDIDFIFHYTIKPNIYGTLASSKKSIPSVAVVSGSGYSFVEKNWLNYIVRVMYRYACSRSYKVWFVNNDDKEMFLNNGIVDESKVDVLPGEGIDIEYFRKSDKEQTDTRDISFLLAGRLLWHKGVGIYVDAARRLREKYPNVQFDVLGFTGVDNPSAISEKQVIEWVKKGYINYLGATDDVRPYLEKTSCFVLPSYYREGVPRSLLEAASLEKPIITTDNVGCKEVVEHGKNGYLCEPRSVEDLVNKMEQFIKLTDGEREKMGREGRKLVEMRFDERFVIAYYERILNKYFISLELINERISSGKKG